MDNNLDPKTVNTEIQVKRLNRLPLFIAMILGIAVLGAIAILIVQSGNRTHKAQEEKQAATYELDENAVNNLLSKKPRYGVINIKEDPPLQEAEPPPKKEQKIAPTPIASAKYEMSPEEKEITRIEAAKLKRLEEALSAPISVKGDANYGSRPVKTSNYEDTSTKTGKGSEDALSNMMKAREGIGQLLVKEDADPNKQQHKADYYLNDQPATEYLLHTRNKQRSPLEIKTGTVIPGIMLSGLNSDLPGMILGQVSQDVYDTATGNYRLIPQGSRLIGTYDNFIAYGQDRALVKWSRLVYPDGSTLELEGMAGTDQAGYAGFEDQVNHHYFKVFGSALLMSVITGAYDYSQHDTTSGGNDYTAGDALSSAVAREISEASTSLLRKNLNIQPTIEIRPGYHFLVMVQKDIIFPDVWQR